MMKQAVREGRHRQESRGQGLRKLLHPGVAKEQSANRVMKKHWSRIYGEVVSSQDVRGTERRYKYTYISVPRRHLKDG